MKKIRKTALRRALSFAAALVVLCGVAAPFAGLTAKADNKDEIERYYQLVDTRVITSVGNNIWYSVGPYHFTNKDEYVKDIVSTTTSLSASQKQPVRIWETNERDENGNFVKCEFGWSTGKVEWTAPPARLDVYRDGRYVPASYSLQYSMDFHNTLCDHNGKDEYWGATGLFRVHVGTESEKYVNFDATSDFDTFWKEFQYSFDGGEFICQNGSVKNEEAVFSASGSKEIKLQDEFRLLDDPMSIVYAVSLGSVKSLVVYMYEYHEGEPEETPPEETPPEVVPPITQEIIEDPIIQNEITPAKPDPGEDKKDINPVIIIGTIIGGTVIAGGMAGKKKKEGDEDDDDPVTFRMVIYKDFGDTLYPGDVKMIYARIVEVDPKTGAERDRPDLSSAIQIFCDDNSFDVQMQNGLYGNYKGAQMRIAEGYSGSEGHVCFQYVGAGGSFTNRVRFKVMGPMLEFDQPNIAIPHDWNKPMKPYFVVLGMGQNHKVTAEITPNDAFDLNITEGESLGIEAAKLYYANITPRSNAPKMDDREAGAAMSYILKVEAYDESTKAKASNELPIARIKTGITLTTKNINCFWYKHVTNEIAEYDGLRRRMVVRDKFARTEAELKLIYFDEENYKMKVLAPLPKAFSLKAEDKEEQELVDKLRIQMDPGDDPAFGPEGGLKVTLQPTKGYLDAPRRIKAKVHIEASANNTVYAADQEIILCSQPDRSHMDLPQISAAIREDEQIEERLRHLQSVIKRDCYSNLFPVHRMIQTMLDGYDSEYGFDEEQLATVINTYNGFCRGEIAGANAEPAEGESLMDYMLWAIDAMGEAADRLEKKAGFLGRLALGFATAGMSEIAFTTMDIVRVPYRMKQAMEQGEDTVLGVMWAGAKEVVAGELQGRVMGAIQSGTWVVAKGFAEGAKNPKLFNIITKAETKYIGYAEKIQKANAKTTIYKDGVYKNPFKADVDPGAAAAGAKQAKLQQKELDALADAKIKESRLKNKIEGETEFGVYVKERADGSLEVVGRDLSDPAVAASFQGYEKVVNMQRAQNKLRQAVTPEARLEARAELEGCMREVRQDFIAQDHLKNYNKLYADEVRLEYDNYWTEMDLRVDRLAAEKIAARTGKNVNDIYCHSVSTNKKDYVHHRHGVDHDMTMMEKVGEGKPDIEINDRIQAEENAMAVYETLTGKKASSVNEAMEFAEKYQYTTVAGEGQYAKEKYGDVAELLTNEGAGRKLKNVEMDANAMQYKVEQFAEKAEMKLAEAEKYPHGSKEYINARSQAYRDFFEANRTGYKQMKRSIMARNEALMLQGKGNKLSQKEQLCYTLLERYYEGARTGHLNLDSGDLMNSMKEIGINSTRDLAVMMNEMTYKVADGI